MFLGLFFLGCGACSASEPEPTGGGCVSNGTGGYECSSSDGCEYPCCQAGVVGTCVIPSGSECGAAAPVMCGGDMCVAPGETCPDAAVPGTDAGNGCESDGIVGSVCSRPAGCPYECCQEGVLRTCLILWGFECGVRAPVMCGGGTCAAAGSTCPDAGALPDAP